MSRWDPELNAPRGSLGGVMTWVWLGVGLFVVLVLLGLLLGWFGAIVGRAGPANVSEQWRFAYDYDEDLRAIARQVCNAEDVLASAPSDDVSARQSQKLAIEQNYERVRADYDARLRDAFRAGIIRPPDVPDRAPSLDSMKRDEC